MADKESPLGPGTVDNPVPVGGQKPVKVGVLPDVHWNDSNKTERKGHLDTIIDQFNSHGVDVVFQVGDLVSVGTGGDSFTVNLTAINECRDYIENQAGSGGNGLDAEIHYQLGNHEYKHLDEGDMSEVYQAMGMGSSLADTCYYVDIRGWRFVSLNSAYSDDPEGNAATFSRVPSAQDPFNALSWLDSVLDTDKHTVLVTHYPFHNASGQLYFSTGNAYRAAQRLVEHGTVTNIHGHTHGHHGWDNGRVEEDPLGNTWYCAGHVDPETWTFGVADGPMHSWANFWTPRRFQFRQTLNQLGRDNKFDGAGNGPTNLAGKRLWSGDDSRYDLSIMGKTNDNTGSGSITQQPYDKRVRIDTGSTDNSRAETRFKTHLSKYGFFSVPEWFATKFTVNSFPSGSGTAKICRGVPTTDTEDGLNWYGFKINASGEIRGIAGKESQPAFEAETDVIKTITQGEIVRISALNWSPHVIRYYVQGDDSNQRDHYKIEEITTPNETTALPYQGAGRERLAWIGAFNNTSGNFQFDVWEWDFYKRGS
jgi:hypothetical protein